jgi:hypothetical protein
MRDSGGIVIPPDVRLAGEALREKELTSDQHRQRNPLTEEPSCEAGHMTEGRPPFTAEIKTLAKGPSTYDPLENITRQRALCLKNALPIPDLSVT